MFYLKEFPRNCIPIIKGSTLESINWKLLLAVLCLSDLLKGNLVIQLLSVGKEF